MITASASYGVHLNMHPASGKKYVRLHHLPCSFYKIQPNRKEAYTFNKNCSTLVEAIERAGEWAVEWNAPLSVCKKRLPNFPQ
jgi:hypothetical protein